MIKLDNSENLLYSTNSFYECGVVFNIKKKLVKLFWIMLLEKWTSISLKLYVKLRLISIAFRPLFSIVY